MRMFDYSMKCLDDICYDYISVVALLNQITKHSVLDRYGIALLEVLGPNIEIKYDFPFINIC